MTATVLPNLRANVPIVTDVEIELRAHGHHLRVTPEFVTRLLRAQLSADKPLVGRQDYIWEYPAVKPIGQWVGLPKFVKGNVAKIGRVNVPYRHPDQLRYLRAGNPRAGGTWYTEPFCVRGRINGAAVLWVPPYVWRHNRRTILLVAGYDNEPGSAIEPLIHEFCARIGAYYVAVIPTVGLPALHRLAAAKPISEPAPTTRRAGR